MTSHTDIEAILRSLTIKEKIFLLAGEKFTETAAITKKGVPSIRTADGPNGVRAPATSPDIRSACFPAASSLAATFDIDLARRFGEALANEARIKNANCILGPTVCMHRHPLGGRNFESFSEDPFLTGKMASQVIQGLQSQGIAATIKHFVANEQETARTSVNEIISTRALREIYLRPFEIAVKEAAPWAIMTAYNLVNGTHCDSHEWLLKDVLREDWRWDGLVMSDWGGTNSVVDSLKAGLDLEMPGPPRIRKLESVSSALEKGEVSTDVIDARVRGVLGLALKLEEFQKSHGSSEDHGQDTNHSKLIRETGARGIVLLKNEDQILPLSPEKVRGKKVALIGFAKDVLAHGGGSASVNAYYKVTPEQALRAALESANVEFSYAKGAHRERLLPPVSLDGRVGTVTDLTGQPGFSCLLYSAGRDESDVTKHGHHSSSYSPLGSNESYLKRVEVIGDFQPVETGKHYLASSGFGPTRVYINDELIIEQKTNTNDPMGSLFSATPETEIQYPFTVGSTYRIRIVMEPPMNIGLEILEGRSGGRLGLSLESEHDADLIGEATTVASKADYAIVFTGHDPLWETEGQDQASFHLPRNQDDLISAVAAANRNTIVVNSTGVAIAMPWLDKVKGLFQAWFPGQECGNSIADVMTGAVNPEGRLPVSFPRHLEDAPAHGNFPGQEVDGRLTVEYAEGVFIGYRHYDRVSREKVNFPFGYGLSYTIFGVNSIGIENQKPDSFDVTFILSNTGTVEGAFLAQIYIGKCGRSADHPIKTLAAFRKISLDSETQKSVTVSVQARDFAFFDEGSQKWVVEDGEYEVILGSSAAEQLAVITVKLERMTWNP